jgi:hypothetical protein
MADFQVVPMTKTLLVEGRSRREGFRGLVLAVGWWSGPPAASAAPSGPRRGVGQQVPELHYLVSDQSKPAPIWVEGRHVSSQRWFPVVDASVRQPGAAAESDAAA